MTVPSSKFISSGSGAAHMPTDLQDAPVAAIIMAGLAGGLDPILGIGDIVIDDCPPGWIPDLPHRIGKIVTSPTMVSTPADKQKLFEQTGALAVDMENEIVRAAALKIGVPFVSIRAISDTAARCARSGRVEIGQRIRPTPPGGHRRDAASPAVANPAAQATRRQCEPGSRECRGVRSRDCGSNRASQGLKQTGNAHAIALTIFASYNLVPNQGVS